jgi:signal transduction histidine kinase
VGDAVAEPEADAAVARRISELSKQLREAATQLETERAERARADWSRSRQLRRIVALHEDERAQIARDLREHLGQQLTALQLTVEAFTMGSALQPLLSDQIQSALKMIAEIGQGLDSAAWELRPAALDDFGLSAVLRDYVQQWSRHTGIRGTFHSGSQDGERFPPEVEATLYRITRTALETIAPGGATAVDVLLERHNTDALLVIEDDAVADEGQHAVDLTRIREGAAALDGTVEIEPSAAGGTTVLVRVPLLTSAYSGPLVTEGASLGASDAAPALEGSGEPTVATVNLLRAKLAELRSAVAARDEFVATVAHELRNPVAPLIFQIRLAIEKTEQMVGANEHVPPDWVQSQFRRAEQRLHRLLETLDRLLDVSRLSTGRVDLQLEPVNLVRAVREVVSSFEAELSVARCPLTLDERCVPTGSWDRIRLEQICRNLLSNAIRFGAGSPIEVTIDGDTDFAILQVRDHGVGIAPDQQARMFERFERGPEQRSGGFGIGLWVVKNICAAMGGTISVESRLGDGACFTVMLPRHSGDTADRAQSDGLHHGTH